MTGTTGTRARRRAARVAAAAVLAGGVVAGAAVPAQAGPPAQSGVVDRERFHDADSFLSSSDPGWPCTSLGFPVRVSYDISGTFHLVARGPGEVYGQENRRGYVSYSANGHTLTETLNVVEKDLKVTRNADGSLSVRVLVTGGDKTYLDGVRLYRNPGQFQYELLILHPFTPDEQVVFVGVVRESTGLTEGSGRDLCGDLADFLHA